MKKDKWEKAKDIFEQAMEIAPESRAKFLDNICPDDKTIRREIEELLRSFDESESFLEMPAVSLKTNKIENGQILGHYEIIEPIGAGGMGEVFLAKDSRLKRKIALKLLPAVFTADKEKLLRFEQEAFAASSLNHPNILTIYEIGASDGLNFIATEFIEGETLRQRIKRGELSFEEILDIAAQTVSAISAAHEAGLIHRDIKPENIMIRRDKLVKVLDFGLAKTVNAVNIEEFDKTLVNTRQGVIMGTVAYMSPEQTRGKDVDARSDLWSFGVVLYEMIAGNVPFEGETASDTIAAILKTNPKPLSAETPAELQRIVNKTLRQNKEERYQTAKDLLIDLKHLKQDLAFTEKLERRSGTFSGEQNTIARPQNTNEQVTKTFAVSSIEYIKSHKIPALLALIVLLAAISGIGYYFFREKPTIANQTQEISKIDSLAVLPFENANQDTEYLSDGITESLINSLSNLPNLRVISRNTVFGFKGAKQTPQEIGRTLNVRTVLTGKILQQGDSFVIQTDLIDATNNVEISGNRFDVKMSELLQIQGKIAQQIADKLQLKLNNQQKANIAKHYTDNVEAYREYLKGRFYTLQFAPDSFAKALEHLNRALEIDPTYALAYAGIADAYTTVSDTFMSPHDALSKAKSAANKALELDNELAEAYSARGHARLHEWDKNATDDLNKAIELAPQTMTNYLWLGEYYMIFDPPQAIPVLLKAAELEPLSPLPIAFLSGVFYFMRQPEKAIEYVKKVPELNVHPEQFAGYYARIYLALGDYKTAKNWLDKSPPDSPDPMVHSIRGRLFALQGNRAEAEKTIVELQKMSKSQYISPYEFAVVYVSLGDRDQTFFYLDKAFKERSENLGFIRNEPIFDSVRDDARYAELMRKIGFE